MKKAITSQDAPAENTPENEAVLEGTSAPTIQEATKSPESKEEVVAEASQPTETTKEEQKEEVPEQPKMVEPSFGNLFKPFSLGATLKQDPSGRNVINGIAAPKMDYVKNAENKKNLKMTEEDFKPKK